MKHRTKLASLLVATLVLQLAATQAQAQQRPVRGKETPNACGNIYSRHYGPYDYRTERDRIIVVEEFHFTPEMEAGIRGRNSTVAGEITYTLKAAPNHHRALVTLINITERGKSDMLQGLEWPAECYFERAIRWAYDDHIVRMLYAQFLYKRNRVPEALKQMEAAVAFADKDNPFAQYNLGLVYLELGQFKEATIQAHKALAMGFPRTDLMEALKKKGQWKEPEIVTSAAPEASASSPNPR